jgi:GNAT superfamily N-acetyltransferase
LIRPTTADDLPAQHAVFRAAIGELFHRHTFDPPNPPLEAFVAQQGHLLAHDAERCFVAEEDGRIVAFSAAMARGDAWYLSSLFVAPEHQAKGIGRHLLERSWGEGYGRRATMTDSIQPASNGLYAQLGLIPTTPMLNLVGKPVGVEPSALNRSEPTAEALELLDLAGYGFSRSVDHAYWSRLARPALWLRDGQPVAYSYAWEHGRIGPLAAVDGAAAADALRGELAERRDSTAVAVVPGTSVELVTTALAAGLRIAGPPALLLLTPPAEPPRALAISGYSLF